MLHVHLNIYFFFMIQSPAVRWTNCKRWYVLWGEEFKSHILCRFAFISFISHYFLYYKKAAENWFVCIFIFRTILFKRNLYIYIGHMVVSGDLQCRICCELIKSKILLLYIIFGYFICKSLLISTKDCVTSVVTGCYENDNI